MNSNIIGTFNLIETVRKYLKNNKVEKFKLLHISTDEVFGSLEEGGKFDELTPYDPRSPYSASKACSDHLVRELGVTRTNFHLLLLIAVIILENGNSLKN